MEQSIGNGSIHTNQESKQEKENETSFVINDIDSEGKEYISNNDTNTIIPVCSTKLRIVDILFKKVTKTFEDILDPVVPKPKKSKRRRATKEEVTNATKFLKE